MARLRGCEPACPRFSVRLRPQRDHSRGQAARRPRGAASLECRASHFADNLWRIAFDDDRFLSGAETLLPSTERESAHANIVQQSHHVVVAGAHTDDPISDAVNLDHSLDYRLHFAR